MKLNPEKCLGEPVYLSVDIIGCHFDLICLLLFLVALGWRKNLVGELDLRILEKSVSIFSWLIQEILKSRV